MENHLIYNQEISFSMSQMIKDLQKALFIILVTIISPIAISAQTANSYLNATTTTGSLATDLNGNAINMSSGTTTLAGTGDDSRSSVTNIGFTFYFAGTAYTQFSTNSNGYCQLGSTRISNTRYDLAGSNPLITPFGEDLIINTSGYNRGKLIGTSPNLCYVIEWNGVGVDYGSTSNNAQFQLRLYETSNKIEFVYGAMAVGNAFNTLTIDGARIGFSSTSSDIRTVVTPNTFQSPTSITGSNVNNYAVGTITDLNSASNGSRRTYVFSPPPTLTVTPTSLAFGYVASGSTSANQTYTLSGSYLSPASGSITVTAPAGFEVSLSSGSGFGSSVNVSYSGSALASTTIYARFKPTGSPQDYSGNITNAGGGATTVNVAVTGSSLAACSGTPAPGNTQASPNPVCIGNSVNLSLQNSVAAKGITYQWQSSPNNSTWTNITPVFLNTDFSSLPTNTNVYGDATVTGGYLRLTRAVNSLTGGWVIQNTPGSNITPFNVTFDYRIYDGGTNGADGMSLSYASDIANNAGPGEEGEGNGIIVKFDTYDNSAGTTNSQIRINYGGSQIWSNTVGAFNLRSSSYRSVKLTVDNNGYLSLSIATTSIVSNLLLPGYKAADKSNWKFKFSARTGGLNDMHSIDNLSIQYGDNPTLSVSPTASTYYRCQATCAVSASTGTSTSALVTVDPLSVAGTASSNQTICSGSSPSNITLSESTGSIQWQSSLDNSNWSDISGATSSTLTSAQMGSLIQTAYYHAVVTSGVCSSATSNAVTVTVDPTSVGGTLSGSASVCSGTNSSKLVLNGYTGSIIKWQYSTIPDGTWTDISNTTSSYFADNLTSTLQYRVQIKSGVCPETYSAATGIYVDPSYTWEGTSSNDWSAVSNWKYTDANYFDNPATPPISCSDVIVPGSAVTYFPTISSPANCKTLTLESGASLLGESNLTYTSATVKREIANDWKWHFLSSPVSNQDIWPQFAPTPDYTTGWTQTSVTQPYWNWDFYYFNPNCPTTGLYWVNLRKLNGDYNNGTEWALNSEAGFGGTTPPEFEKGRGYLVAYDVDWYPTQNPTNHVFSGSLYTGLVTKAIINNQSEFNLVGNPYPSSLDWKSTSWGTGRDNLKYDENAGGYDYWIWNDSDGNYGVFNSGGTTGTHGTSQYIAPTQAFFVKASSSGNFDMNNNVRAHSTQSWLKQSELANSALLLRLTTDVNSFNDEIIVEFDQLFTGGGSDKLWSWYTEAPEFYTVKAGNNYSIERNTEANEDAVVNISAKCGVDANYTITATNIADFALCNKVYLEDLKTGNKINLKENNSYSFAGGPNDDRARFKLTFAETIGTDEPETIKPLYIYSVGKDVFINANQLTVGKSDIFIYDALGRLVYRGVYTPAAGNVKHTSLITPGAYVVKAITRTGTITAKIIIP